MLGLVGLRGHASPAGDGGSEDSKHGSSGVKWPRWGRVCDRERWADSKTKRKRVVMSTGCYTLHVTNESLNTTWKTNDVLHSG